MNESQLKAFVRQAFALQDTADRTILDVDRLLGVVMLEVKRLVETLPDASLLREKTWRELKPLVRVAMAPYAKALQQAVYREEVIAAPEMLAYAEREARYAGASIIKTSAAPLQADVMAAVDRAVIGRKRFRQWFMEKAGPVPPWVDGMYRIVDQNVRTGILQGQTTKDIADQVVHETISRGVKGVTLQGQTSVRRIRAQAMAMTRTVTQDVQRQIKEQFWDANSEALEGFVYQWSAALDSRTCQTCAPLDGKRWDNRSDAPRKPIHVNCRCDLLLIDPEDEFWNEGRKTGQQLGEKEFSQSNPGSYKTKVKVKGERFYRQARQFTGNDYGDYLASSNKLTQIQFFGGGEIGERRMLYFRSQLDRMNKDPMQILESMLTGPTTSRKFIAVPE